MDELKIEHGVRDAAAALESADALLITAGAGMGVDSGLPDFRGKEGFWRAYPVIAKLGLSFEEMANPTWFDRDPELAWAFYGHRLNLYRSTAPHRGFHHLLELGNRMPHGCFIFTSNVDGHFQKAGFSADRILECHGSIHHLQCMRPCCAEIWDAEHESIQLDLARFRAIPPLPRCIRCTGLARPNVLMFGDWNWVPRRTDQQEQAFDRWLRGVQSADGRIAVIELGAGSTISTVRQLSERIAHQLGGKLIRINPRECDVSRGHVGLPLGAAEGLDRIAPIPGAPASCRPLSGSETE